MKVLLVVGVGTALFTGCSRYTPDAGHEVVLVEKPMFFGHGGVDTEPVRTGSEFAALTTDGIDVNMQPQRFDVSFDDTMTADGVPVSFHAMMALQVTNSVDLIKNFGPKWYESNIEPEFMTEVRQAVRKHGMNETAISSTAIDAIDNEISQAMTTYVKGQNLPVRLVKITLGKANPPDAIKHQRIETAAQEQRSNTEKQRKLAEDQRLMAEQSRANADNAYRESMHLSPEQFIQLKMIEMQRDVCGGGHCTFILGSGVSPVYNIK